MGNIIAPTVIQPTTRSSDIVGPGNQAKANVYLYVVASDVLHEEIHVWCFFGCIITRWIVAVAGIVLLGIKMAESMNTQGTEKLARAKDDYLLSQLL